MSPRKEFFMNELEKEIVKYIYLKGPINRYFLQQQLSITNIEIDKFMEKYREELCIYYSTKTDLIEIHKKQLKRRLMTSLVWGNMREILWAFRILKDLNKLAEGLVEFPKFCNERFLRRHPISFRINIIKNWNRVQLKGKSKRSKRPNLFF